MYCWGVGINLKLDGINCDVVMLVVHNKNMKYKQLLWSSYCTLGILWSHRVMSWSLTLGRHYIFASRNEAVHSLVRRAKTAILDLLSDQSDWEELKSSDVSRVTNYLIGQIQIFSHHVGPPSAGRVRAGLGRNQPSLWWRLSSWLEEGGGRLRDVPLRLGGEQCQGGLQGTEGRVLGVLPLSLWLRQRHPPLSPSLSPQQRNTQSR